MPKHPQQPSGPEGIPDGHGDPRFPGNPPRDARSWPDRGRDATDRIGEVGETYGDQPGIERTHEVNPDAGRRSRRETRQVRQPRVEKREAQIRAPERRVEPVDAATGGGERPRRGGNAALWTTVGVLGVLALGAGLLSSRLGDGGSTAAPPPAAGGQSITGITTTPLTTTTTATTTVPVENLAGVGEPVQDGGLRYVVNSVDCSKSTLGDRNSVKGKWCVVALDVRNTGTTEASMPPDQQWLVDTREERHPAQPGVAEVLGDAGTAVWRPIAPETGFIGELAFDVPTDAQPKLVELNNTQGSGGSMISLGG